MRNPKTRPVHEGPDLLDMLSYEEGDATMANLCKCGNTGVSGGGWTLDPTIGLWVHGNPACRKPRYIPKKES